MTVGFTCQDVIVEEISIESMPLDLVAGWKPKQIS